MKAAMKILDAKAAVEQVETCTGLDFKNVTPKPEVVQQAKKDGKLVHFAFLMHLCRLEHSELENISQNT